MTEPNEPTSRQLFWRDIASIGYGLILLLLLVAGFLGYRNANRLSQQSQWVEHTYQVIAELEALLASLVDAETGQRGFLLTGDERYLEPYHEALPRLRAEIANLERLTADNRVQQTRLREADKLIAARLAVLRQTLDLARASNREGAVDVVRGDLGKELMDGTRRLVATMQETERGLLARRTAESEGAFRSVVWTFLLTTGIGSLLVSVVFFLTQRNTRLRQRAAATIAEQRERLRITLASIGDAVISTDTEGRVTNLNAVAEQLTGWTRESAAGQPLETVFHIVNEATRRLVENPATRALREGIIVGLANHTVLIARDGQERFIDDSAAPIRSSEGEIVGSVLVFRDISEKREADLALKTNAAEYRSLFEAMGVGNAEVELPSGRYIRVNQRYGQMLGYTREELEGGMTYLDVTHPDDRERILENLEPLGLGQPGTFEIEKRYLRKDGSLLWAHLTVTVVHTGGGRRIRLLKTANDVTERKRAEELLSADLKAMTRLQALSTRMVQAGDLESLLLEILVAKQDITGASAGSIQLYEPETGQLRTVVEQSFGSSPAAGANEPVLQTTPLVSREGKLLGHLNGRYGSSHEAPEQELRFLDLLARMAADFVERWRNEQALRDSSQRQNEFLAMLAHELRNPLAPIRSALDVIKLTGEGGEIVSHATAMMERQVAQLVRFVDDLLDVSRISRGKIELRKGTIELASAINNAVEAARPLCESLGNGLEVTVPREAMYLNADPARIAQVVGNLLNNACKFTDRGGQVSLAVEREGNQAVLRVRDTGIGIAAEQLSRIFEMFMQVDTSLERQVSGLGIGLKLVKTLVELHDGSVEAYSDGLGHGSEFVVRLPVLTEAPKASAEPPVLSAPKAASARRVLVIDDNRDAATLLARLLKLKGHDARTANDGLEALDLAREFRPELIFCDIGLPKMDGYEVGRRIRQEPWGKAALLVAVTGWGQEEYRQKSKDAGFDGHLVKPVEIETFTRLLGSLEPKDGAS